MPSRPLPQRCKPGETSPSSSSFSIYFSQNVIKAIGGREGAHQVIVDVGKTVLRDGNRLRRDLKMAMDFPPLANSTLSHPGGDIFAQTWPDKPTGNEPACLKSAWEGNVVDVMEHCPVVFWRYQWSPHPGRCVPCEPVTLNVLKLNFL